MKKLIAIICATLALSAIGANEDGLHRIWTSSDGKKTFIARLTRYSSPNVTVRYPTNKELTFDESLLSVADIAYCVKAIPILAKCRFDVRYRVTQVVPDGIFCTSLDPEGVAADQTFFIRGKYDSHVAEKEIYRNDLYWAGSYSYESIDHATRTLRSYALSLDHAMTLWDRR